MTKLPEVTLEQWDSVSEENKKIVAEFLSQNVQLSLQTIKQYTSALRNFYYWIKVYCDDKPFHKIKSKDYLFYQNHLTKEGLASSAVKFKRSAISSLNNYIALYYGEEFPLFRNFINKGIASPPPAFVHKKEPLTIEEYNAVCSKLEEQELYQVLAYLKFSFASGARRAEVRQLTKDVVNFEPKSIGDTLIYTTGLIRCKGRGVAGKVRTLQFDDAAMIAIKKWLSIRGDDSCPHVFVAKHNGEYKQVGDATFNTWGKTYVEPLLGRRFHPHQIRESRATSMVVEQGKDIKSAQKLLGHMSSTTTEIYVIRKDNNDADEAFT